jgi:collagenase-like PrtC family protease
LGNQEFDQRFVRKLKDFLKQLDCIGVEYITVGLPSIISIIEKEDYGFKLKISTVCQINNAQKAIAYKKLGADTIVLDESINRDFNNLKNIRKAFGQQVELIVNVICHKNCIYELFHHNQTSHDSDCNKLNKSTPFYSHRCMIQRCENPENLLKLAWIRPEDLIRYNNIGYNIFKIQGRQAAENGNILKTVEAYMMREYNGNLMLLLDCFQPTNTFIVNIDNRMLDDYLTPFFCQEDFCKNYCDKCNYCKKYMQKHFNYNEIKETFNLANMFYREIEEVF